MSLINKKLLSAYLDGELGADRRRQVEEALQSDARLRAELAEMRRIRGWVAALPRPAASQETSAAVLQRIGEGESQRSGARIGLRHRPVRVLSMGMALAAAAVLYVMLLVIPGRTGRGPGMGTRPIGDLASSKGRLEAKAVLPKAGGAAERIETERVEGEQPGSGMTVATSETEGPAGSVEAPGWATEGPAVAVVEARQAETAEVSGFRDLIAGEKRLVRIVVSGRSGEKVDLEAVAQVLRDCPRQDPRYGRFEGEAGEGQPAFALVGERVEVDLLLSRLRERFGGSAVTIEQPRESGEEQLREALASSLVVERGRKGLPRVESSFLMHSQKVEEDLIDPVGPRGGHSRPGTAGTPATGTASPGPPEPSTLAVFVIVDEEGKP